MASSVRLLRHKVVPREFLRLRRHVRGIRHLPRRRTSRSGVNSCGHGLHSSADLAADADVTARHVLELAETTDLVLNQAEALLTLADVLDARDLGGEAAAARSEAIVKLRTKGNLVAVARLGA